MAQELTEQETLRIAKLEELKKLGINPYPSEEYKTSHHTSEIFEKFSQNPDCDELKNVSLAGRLMSIRIMGKASFAVLQDFYGKIQLYIQRDCICSENDTTLYDVVFKKLIDLGDIVGVKGYVFVTKMGEVTLHVTELKLLSKSLHPLPVVKQNDEKVFDAFSNPEQRYRQRYVDLIVNRDSLEVFKKRTKIVQTMRNFMNEQGFYEVETPILQPLYGGAAARPFCTHHNTLDQKLYLRISDELYLKRLIIGGYEGVYEFSKDFRNEGMDRFHNPEFTQVELYVAYKDYKWMMHFAEHMIEQIAISLYGTTKVQVGENVIDFKTPWKRYTMFEIIEHYTGIDISKMKEEELREVAEKLGIHVDKTLGYGKIIDEIFGETCEKKLIQPTFVTDYPTEMSPLAKQRYDDPNFVERFEGFCNCKEICNAFSELNDPIEQRKRFENEAYLAKRGDEEAMQLDEDFLNAMSYGMPPTAGIGIGIDRLTMILANANSIQDVLFFPQMRNL